ncbi:MAG: MFS transporter [Actinomycetota bacterium]
MRLDPARIYLWSGLLWFGAMRAFWIALVVRVAIALQLTSLQLVLLGTAMELALLVSEVPTGVLADRFSRKWSIVLGFVGVGVAQVLAGVAETFPLLVLTQVLWGVMYTFRSGADAAWITDELGGPEQVEALILRRARLQQVAAVVAIAVGAAVARFTTLSTAIVLTGLVLAVTGMVLALVMPERHGPRSRRTDDEGEREDEATSAPADGAQGEEQGMVATFTAGLAVVRRSTPLRLLVAATVIGGLGSEAIDRLDIRRLDDLGLSARVDEVVAVGVIAAVEALAGALILWWTRHRVAGATVPLAFAVMTGLAAGAVALLGLVAVLPVAALGLILQGGLRQAAMPLAEAWANAHAPSSVRATVHSFVGQADGIGQIVGGVALGLVAATTTVPTAMSVSVALMVVAALVAARARAVWPTTASGGPSRFDRNHDSSYGLLDEGTHG